MEKLLNLDSKIELFVLFNTGINERLINLNDTYNKLGTEVSAGVMFFHCFSGCDSTTAFLKKSKNILFKTWMTYPKIAIMSDAFKALSWSPSGITLDSSICVINEFIAYVYAGESVQLNTARFDIYKRSKSFRELPQSEDALRLHVKRSAFQAGWIWGTHFHKVKSLRLSTSAGKRMRWEN